MTGISVCESSPPVGAALPGETLPVGILPADILPATVEWPKCCQA